MGIALIIFRYNDMLTEQAVYDRLLDAIRNSPFKKEEKQKNSFYSSKAYLDSKKRRSELRKKAYRELKQQRKNNNGKT
jgi:predicted nucleotide-binding protein (sugar kinase/HSP70/actin superfamily)